MGLAMNKNDPQVRSVASSARLQRFGCIFAAVLAAQVSGSQAHAQSYAFSLLAGNAGKLDPADGTGSSACFFNPTAVAVDGSGNIYVTDGGDHTVRRVTAGGVVTTFAGSSGQAGSTDGTGSGARFL